MIGVRSLPGKMQSIRVMCESALHDSSAYQEGVMGHMKLHGSCLIGHLQILLVDVNE